MCGIAIFLKVCIKLDSMLSDHMQFGIQLIEFAYDTFEFIEIATVLDSKIVTSLLMMCLCFPKSVDLIS